jgi:hypothetical protein
MPEPRLRELQPPHGADHFTLEQAMEAWKKVEADRLARAARKRDRAARQSARRSPSTERAR